MDKAEYINVTDTPKTRLLQSAEDHDILMAVIGILSFFSVIGTVGNALVLYVYIKKRNKLASTVFIITLAGTDFVTCILIIPYTIVLEYVVYYVKYDFLCKFYMFLITSNVPFSAFIMTAIAVDRYLCICHPFTHILNKRIAKMIISLLATVAFILGIITALNYGVYFKKERNTTQIDERDNAETSDIYQSVINSSTQWTEVTYVYESVNGTSPNNVKNVSAISKEVIEYGGMCQPNGLIFSHRFTNIYQKVYSSFFVIVIVVVVVLYILIYKFVSVRRAKRRRMRSQRSMYSSYKESPTTFVNTRASLNNGSVKTELDMESVADEPRPKTEKTVFLRRMTIREKGLVANIRTAAMLFVVTAVFIIVFLPAWLMAHEVLPYNMLIFYMYFFYNVANPIIYAFMNKAFRRDLKDVIECRVTQ
ncbi:formyl peptide receptor-related sequence 3-like [Mercenaria mercenaria]|uniref:formyl peptide receptor-related sequence 3-like n=1 Tax=Mercenaria mercenaria TaxID=6596 RepID=UPI00234ECD5E|nr:formyl peptide receptor-related sequence 3-like [Mercenaria mercenaria]XP_045163675.2 formyl peptide receptor-related sequence 3-like [Mercenaria mercenaria]